ncbi:hypothetical protein EZV73_14350 [Acidaminobacter sp. JC074]|uniref:LiaF transmembrane domain-containing protein n=1 Tax=Acidaminobacter sp. JC074 TaxID=2530199 RepID=UPI001F106FAA|nr:DUF5668 domain-containing protein [Acidaminobacter sp. JC074]MCH4888772.1 hypothetical protein [Acidaminobacter sp. JC074]
MKSNKNVFAIALIAIGVLLTIQVFNVPFLSSFNLGNIIGVLWPLFILIPGINMLKNKVGIGGIVLTLIGGSFLLENTLELIGVSYEGSVIFKFFWPVVLIYVGFRLLTNDKKIKFDGDFDDVTDNYDGESNSKTTNITFNSKKYIFKYDEMNDGFTSLNLNISFGGAEIIVEDDIQVFLVGQYTLGGYEFFELDGGGFQNEIKEVRYPDNHDQYDKTLVIKANIALGGLEIRRR